MSDDCIHCACDQVAEPQRCSAVRAERDALRAENERLREQVRVIRGALERIVAHDAWCINAHAALAATHPKEDDFGPYMAWRADQPDGGTE